MIKVNIDDDGSYKQDQYSELLKVEKRYMAGPRRRMVTNTLFCLSLKAQSQLFRFSSAWTDAHVDFE